MYYFKKIFWVAICPETLSMTLKIFFVFYCLPNFSFSENKGSHMNMVHVYNT